MELDLDKFKAMRPWRDITFWVAVATSLTLLVPLVIDAWGSARFPTGQQIAGSVAPITAWLVMHGVVRYGGVRAAGDAAAAVGPEIARYETVYRGHDPALQPYDQEQESMFVDDTADHAPYNEARDAATEG